MRPASRGNAPGWRAATDSIARREWLDGRNSRRPARDNRRLGASASPYARPLHTDLNVGLEELVLVLLAVGALFGIAYGFSCLVDLVQHWAVFERGVANLI